MREYYKREYYDIISLSVLWNVSPQTIRRLIKSGKLPAVRIGGSFRIRNSDRENYEKENLYAAREND